MDTAQIISALPALIVTVLTALVALTVSMILMYRDNRLSKSKVTEAQNATAAVQEKLKQAELQAKADELTRKSEMEAMKLSSERSASEHQTAMERLGIEFARKLQDQHQQILDDMHKQTVAFTAQISVLTGEKNQLARTIAVMENRLEQVGEQKYEAIVQANQIQAELEAVHAAEQASATALTKANELIQNYERQIDQYRATINSLQTTVNEQAVRIGKLETELEEIRRNADERHASANAITARNMRYAVYLMQYKITLQAITNAIPFRSMPPEVIKELAARSIDVPHLLNVQFDNDAPEVKPDPLTIDLKSTKEMPVVQSGDMLAAPDSSTVQEP